MQYGRKAEWEEGRKAGREDGRKAGDRKGEKAGWKGDRKTDKLPSPSVMRANERRNLRDESALGRWALALHCTAWLRYERTSARMTNIE